MGERIEIGKIPTENVKYVGYLWMSDSKVPKQYENEVITINIIDNPNPFIVEGQLYTISENEELSYSIKYVDGRHSVIQYNLKNIPSDWEAEIKEFIPNRLTDPNRLTPSKIIFKQLWEPKEDAFCEGMKVLVPTALVFVGFKYEKKR